MKNQKKIFSGITVFITMVILFVLNACQNAAGGDTKNNTEKEKNFTITIKCPNGLVGKKLQVHHLPDKIESRTYSGGWAKISDSGIAVYSQNLHFANWDLSLIYLQKENTVSSGDLFCFYTAQGFSRVPDGTKSLKIEEGSKTVLHADLTNHEKVKTIEEEERASKALHFVMGASMLNHAILSIELAPELELTYSSLESMVDSLPDNLAKKWYMKGIIAANNPNIESENDFSTLIQEFGTELAVKMQTNETPKFLAYFQHCFDIDPTFYTKFYKTDANVSDEVRKKYPYDEEKKDIYREKFRYLMMKPKAAELISEE